MVRALSVCFLLFVFSSGRLLAGDDLAQSLAKVKALAEAQNLPTEKFLAEIYDSAQSALSKKSSWPEVKSVLEQLGWRPMPVETMDDFTRYRCTILTQANLPDICPGMQLFLDLGVCGGRRDTAPGTPLEYSVSQIWVGLVADHLAQSPEAASRKAWLKPGTMIDEAFATWPVVEALKENPVLDELELSFAMVVDAAIGPWDPGYHLKLVLVREPEDRRHGIRLQCTALQDSRTPTGRASLENWRSEILKPPGDLATLSTRLRETVAAQGSWQERLARATHLLQDAVLGQDWATVSAACRQQGFQALEQYGWRYGGDFLVAEKACAAQDGLEMDLLAKFRPGQETSPDAVSRELVQGASAVLRIMINRPCEQVLSGELFGQETAIEVLLRHPKVRDAIRRFPTLGQVEVEYDILWDRWSVTNDWGFTLELELLPKEDPDSGRMRVSGRIASGLDRPVAKGGTVLSQGFVAQDVLGRIDRISVRPASVARARPSVGNFMLRRADVPRVLASDGPELTRVYSLGDLAKLPADTPGIIVERRSLNDAELALLARFTNLQTLWLQDCESLTDKDLRHLAGLSRLRHLELPDGLTGSGFIHLQGLAELRELFGSAKCLTDAGLAELARLRQLTSLSLWSAHSIDDRRLNLLLAGLPGLRQLSLNGSGITDGGLRRIADLAELEELSISHSGNFTASGLAELARPRRLKRLGLFWLPLKDDVLSALTKIDTLQNLSLWGLSVTDRGIQGLAALPHLERIRIGECPGVTTDGIRQLHSALPGKFLSE